MKLSKDKIMLLLARRQMTQKDLAEKADLSRSNLSAIVNGKNCRWVTALRIADTLGVELDDIVEAK